MQFGLSDEQQMMVTTVRRYFCASSLATPALLW